MIVEIIELLVIFIIITFAIVIINYIFTKNNFGGGMYMLDHTNKENKTKLNNQKEEYLKGQ